jgi:hypothetical protein
MPDSGKSKRQVRDRSHPPPRDPRVDSSPPFARDDTPLQRVPSSRPTADAVATRLANLEAEGARLREQHASDADQLAAMLVRIAEVERARTAAEQRAAESDEHAETLSVALGQEKARTSQLEADGWEASETLVREVRAQLAAAQATQATMQRELAAAREAMGGAMALLEELERREEMVGSLRARALDQMKKTLGGPATLPPPSSEGPPIQAMPIRSVAPMKSMKEAMAEPEPFLDLDLSE